ncbi:uncharacterized protein LOC128208118 isoform X3 [Mya arenaria]|uniref:uncharacterized protein LOC128208118 isoform X3 n=1 Tax=Mya arenaria TaxID=6604 RepID=UPI0022E229DB|nr:uncharacterized protein LOC128208118 isoform X3 [Mya arenaria]
MDIRPVKVRGHGNDDNRSSYYMMLNNITNDLDLLLSEFCDPLDPGEPPPIKNKPMRTKSKKPVGCESGSAFGGSSTSGTLTSTDSNVSNREGGGGTLTSTDSGASLRQQQQHFDLFPLPQSRVVEGGASDRQQSPSQSTSGSDLRQISVLERLSKTHSIWLLPQVGRSGAVHLLKNRDVGIFIVRRSSQEEVMALSVQFPDHSGSPNIDHYLIVPTPGGYHLRGSTRLFPAIPNLLAYFCEQKEDLPHRLVLPPSIMQSKTSQELTALAMLGQDFWTSSKYDGHSRSSSRSNLSEHSSVMNKSHSEPISINKAAVMAYSQSDAILQNNTPPKHSVIDFSSYLIQKPSPGDADQGCAESLTASCVKSVTKQQESVHSKCSVSGVTQTFLSQTESRTSSHMTVSQVKTGCESCHEERQEDHGHRLVLHVNDKENRVDIRLAKRDSQVSVPYAKPNKHPRVPSVLSPELLQPLCIPEECYWGSNLSDKMSDYEDIWKNNYADPRLSSAQANILQHLQPQLVSPSSPSANYQYIGDSFTEQWHSAKHVVKDLNVSLDKLDIAKESVHNKECVSSSHIVSKTKSVIVAGDKSDAVETLTDSKVSYNSKENAKECRLPSVNFDIIPEQESDLDSDPSNGCHSDDDLGDDADTEDSDEGPEPRINSVQTQTSPMWKLKSPPFGKSISTNSLSTMKSPVYAEPFDAISPDEKAQGKVCDSPKKLRRRSAPAVSVARRRHLSTECHKLKHVETEVSTRHRSEVKPSTAGNGKSDEEDVFEISLELLNSKKSNPKLSQDSGACDLRWVDSKLSSPSPEGETTSKNMNKPMPLPRKTKVSKNLLHTAVNNRRNMNGAAVRKIEQWRLENNVRNSSLNADSLQFFEEFDENHNSSSQTLSKFPVHNRHFLDDGKVIYSEGSTAEDIITSWNPELTLRPMQPFPIYGPQSEYDNLNSTGTPYIAPSGQSVNSTGTIFHPPWEHGMVAKIMHISTHGSPAHDPLTSPAPSHAPPPLPTLDPHERIKAWQQSSQKYAPCFPASVADNDEAGITMVKTSTVDQSAGNKAQTCSYDGQGPNKDQKRGSNSDRTVVNEKTASHSSTITEKTSDNMPVYGSEFQERIAPVLAHPRLLHQMNRNRVPDRAIREYIIRLSEDRNTTFGSTIHNFIQCTLDSHDADPHNATRNVRQFMTGIKNYLVKHGEGELEDLIERERSQLGRDEILNIDAIIEGALHVCVIQPLKHFIYQLYVNELTRNGNLHLLSANIKYARTKTAAEIGIRPGLQPPDGATLEVIGGHLSRMQKAFSPLEKLEHLLAATATIYRCIAKNQKESKIPVTVGADDFLPMLIYVLVQCGLVSVEIEASYMLELLHPSLLVSEGGYYLTSLSGAIYVLQNFQQMHEASSPQQGKVPSISDMQGFLKIAIPDEQQDTIVWRTLPVRPNMTTRDVCGLIAHKYKFTNPQDYGLYTLENGEEHRLMEMECPASLKTDRLARQKDCIFAYKRNAANIAWPKSVQ